jgi:hypothetical protein
MIKSLGGDMKKLIIILSLLLSLSMGQDYSLSFDGVDDWVGFSSALLLQPEAFTISVNLRPDESHDSAGRVYNQQDGGQFHIILSENYQNEFQFGVNCNGWQKVDTEILYDNMDHEYTAIYIAHTGLKLYRDGFLVDSLTNTSMGTCNTNSELPGIGGPIHDEQTDQRYKGTISNMSIWEGVLNQDEISNYILNGVTENSTDLISNWNFNAGVGDTLYDYSGNGNHGIIHSATWVENIEGCTDSDADNYDETANVDDGSCEYPDNGDYSLSFDGVDDYVEIPSNSNLVAQNNTLTIEAWVRVPTSNNNGHATVVGARSSYGYILYAGSTDLPVPGAARFDINTSDENSGFDDLIGTTDLRDDQWHYIAATYDGITAKIYVDGILENSMLITTEYLVSLSGGENLNIGKGNHTEEYFVGELDGVGIWNTALTEQAIIANMETTPTGNEEGLVSYWKFNAGTGTTLYDHSGNGNHGTLMNMDESSWILNGCTDPCYDEYNPEAEVDNGSCDTFIGCPDNGDYSLSFDGGYVELDNPLTWGLLEIGTIKGSFNINSLGGAAKYILGESVYQGYGALGVRVEGDGSIWATHNNNNCAITGGLITTGVDYQFIMTWHNSTSILDFYLYSENQTNLGPVNSCGMSTSSNPNGDLIGKGWDGYTWDGYIDDLVLWDIYFDSDTAEYYFENEPIATDSNLVGYWKFNSGTGTTLYDHSGNGNHGTINGATTWIGCTDPLAENFLENAEFDDGSCIDSPVNPSDFTYAGEFDGSYYYLSNYATSWNEAKNITENNGGHLATIENEEENSFIQSILQNHSWIGLFQNHDSEDYIEPNGGWEWVTGEDLIYNNWNPGNPSDSNSGEDFAEITIDGQWNDLADNDGPLFIILEIEPLGCTDENACNYKPYATEDDGSCAYEADCNDVCGGSAVVDECGICDGSGIPDGECDCEGNIDDCNGYCGGEAYLDDCGVCSAGMSGHSPNSDIDCNGDCAEDTPVSCEDTTGNGQCGNAAEDDCNMCSGGNSGHIANADMDGCSVCFSDNFAELCIDTDDCSLMDCNGDCNGESSMDDCNVCSEGNSGHLFNSDIDCNGECFGIAIVDSFDSCCLDPAHIDGCGECGGNDYDLCDGDGDGDYNIEDWGYGAHGFGDSLGISVEDIPEDQGGRVYITFHKSFYDTDTLRNTESYQIERFDDEWIGVATQNAYADSSYKVEVSTFSDSSSTNSGLTSFRVIANMEEGNFVSLDDENGFGYSVDNIHPSTPDDVMASSNDNYVDISWDYSQDIDFDYHQVTELDELQFTISNDVSILLLGDYNEYYMNSVDIHHNYSDKSDYVGAHDLHAGANLVSFSVLPEDNSITNVIVGDVSGVIGEGVAANNIPPWVGSLTSIDTSKGYWVKADSDFIHLTIGQKLYVESYDLHIGANLISYTCSGDTTLSALIEETCIEGIIGEGVAANNLPSVGWVGSLTNLKPGKGYWFKASEDCELSYDCPEPSMNQLVRYDDEETVKDYTQSTEQAFYFIEDIENIEVGDIVSAYCNDTKVGSREWNGAYTDIPAMGNDNSDLTKDYCTSNQVPTFRVEKPSGETYALTGDIPVWESNGLHMLSSLQEAIILPENYSLAAAYPNPFNPTTTINFAIPADTEVSISVYNLQGREVVTLANGSYDAGYHSVIWNADTHSSGVYFVKMVAGSYVNTQKLMLVK